MSPRISALLITAAVAVPALIVAQQATQERVDLNVLHRIKVAEFGTGGGFGGGGGGRGRGPQGGKVMDLAWNLTDRYGPRLTNSPQFRAAGDWAVGQLKEWGLANVKLEAWPTKDVQSGAIPGWQVKAYSGAMIEPSYMPIIGVPIAWTSGTNGPVTGEVATATIDSPADLDKYHGKLKGKIVFTAPLADLPFPTTPLASRYTKEELADLETESIPTGRGGRGGAAGRGGFAALAAMTPEERTAFQEKQRNF